MRHAWHLPEEEYLRHERRRGRRHAFKSLVPTTTCLVVVDMIPFFVDANPYAQGIVAEVSALADRLRQAGGLVSWVVPSSAPLAPARSEFFGPEVAESYRVCGGGGRPGDRVSPDLVVQPSDLVVEKTTPSAFLPTGSDLHDTLQRRGIETVVVAGTVANVCCESTARDASSLGYRTIFAADANAADSDDALNATLRTIYRSFGDVRPTNEILQLIDDRGHRPG